VHISNFWKCYCFIADFGSVFDPLSFCSDQSLWFPSDDDMAQFFLTNFKLSAVMAEDAVAICQEFFSHFDGASHVPDQYVKFGGVLLFADTRPKYTVQVDVRAGAHLTLGAYNNFECAVLHVKACKEQVPIVHELSIRPFHGASYLIGGVPQHLYFTSRPPHLSLRMSPNLVGVKDLKVEYPEAYIYAHDLKINIQF